MNQNNFNGPGKSSMGMEENVAALLSYVLGFITGIIFFFGEKQSRFVRFHAMQSILVYVCLFVVEAMLWWIPVIGWILIPLIALAAFVLWIFLMMKAYNMEWFKLPIIGDIAEKQANL